MAQRPPKADFGKPPAGYVAGVGRGARGFTTRSDYGAGPPAEELPENLRFGQGRARSLTLDRGRQVAAQLARGASMFKQPSEDLSESNYDPFAGYTTSLINPDAVYDKEDIAADEVYASVDRYMGGRRQKKRLEQEKKEEEEARRKRPKIKETFASLKAGLAAISEQDWMNIPEPGDYSKHNKRVNQREDRFTPIPDSIISAKLQATQSDTSIGTESLKQMHTARDRVLGMQLDKKLDSVAGFTVVDPQGYLTQMNTAALTTASDVSDVKRARTLLRSVTKSNPQHAQGWIALARLEETAGDIQAAKAVLKQGCDRCLQSEDVWLEALRIHGTQEAKQIAEEALECVPSSIALWKRYAELEQDLDLKREIYRRALDEVPQSEQLWKEAVAIEGPKTALPLLREAVVNVTQSTDLWLALARLEPYESAKKALNKAISHNRTDLRIWLAAAGLEEKQGHEEKVTLIVRKAVKKLAELKLAIQREDWLREAQASERNGNLVTCRAIVSTTIGIGVDVSNRKRRWLKDAALYSQEGAVETVTAIYHSLVTTFPHDEELWWAAIQFSQLHRTWKEITALLQDAVNSDHCPHSTRIWSYWVNRTARKNPDEARDILKQALDLNSNDSALWESGIVIEYTHGTTASTRHLLRTALKSCPSPHLYELAARLERECDDTAEEIRILDQGLAQFPTNASLWDAKGQCMLHHGHRAEAMDVYRAAIAVCPPNDVLQLGLIGLEQNAKRKRAMLEHARQLLPQSDTVWYESIQVESRHGDRHMVDKLLSKALQTCPQSGLLWAASIRHEVPAKRKARIKDALTACPNDAYVCCEAARVFWRSRKREKAKDWFERGCAADPLLGDIWCYYVSFLAHNTDSTQASVRSRCLEAKPKHGILWKQSEAGLHHCIPSTSSILDMAVSNINASGDD